MDELRRKKNSFQFVEQLCLADTSKKGIELNSSGPRSKSVALPPTSFFHFFSFFFLLRFLLLPHETSHLHFRTSAKLIFWSLAAPQWYQRDQVKQHPTLALCCVSIMQRCATGRMCLCLFRLQCAFACTQADCACAWVCVLCLVLRCHKSQSWCNTVASGV